MKRIAALAGGLAGASALTIVHEIIKRINPKAPRMDLLGMNALTKILRAARRSVPGRQKLFLWTMVGDIISNSLYYSLLGIGNKKGVLTRGVLLGLSAGLGALLLPKPMKLNEKYSNRTRPTQIMTVGLYLLGGLIASAAIKLLTDKK